MVENGMLGKHTGCLTHELYNIAGMFVMTILT